MRNYTPTTTSTEAGFTLPELLVVTLIGAVLLAGFAGFYLSEQRAFRHHQIEVETSQALRMALEQMSRDLRVAGRDLTQAAALLPAITYADATRVDYRLDANDDGDALDAGETREFLLCNGAVSVCNGNGLSCADPNCGILADFVSSLTLSYRDCNGNALTAFPLNATDRGNVTSIDVSLSVQRPIVGGMPVLRSEVESVRIRNKVCS